MFLSIEANASHDKSFNTYNNFHNEELGGTHIHTHIPAIQTLSQARIPRREQTHTPCREGKQSLVPNNNIHTVRNRPHNTTPNAPTQTEKQRTVKTHQTEKRKEWGCAGPPGGDKEGYRTNPREKFERRGALGEGGWRGGPRLPLIPSSA